MSASSSYQPLVMMEYQQWFVHKLVVMSITKGLEQTGSESCIDHDEF